MVEERWRELIMELILPLDLILKQQQNQQELQTSSFT